MRSSFVISALTPLAVLAATPPACLIAAISQQGMPPGVEAVCDVGQEKTLSNLVSMCNNDDLQPAYDAFASTCREIGIDVAALPAPSTSSSSSSSAPIPSATVTSSASSVVLTLIPTPSETKPASAAAAIAPHAVIFTIFGLCSAGLFSIIFL